MLNEKQTRFIAEYLSAPGDPTGAALRAGYSPGRARRQARALLADPAVSAQIERKQADALVSPERVIRELAKIAFADPAEMVYGSAEPVWAGGLPPASTRSLSAGGKPPAHGEAAGGAPGGRALQGADGEATPVGRADPTVPLPETIGTPPVGRDALIAPQPAPNVPFPAPGSGTGLKLKYTPKRAPDGGTVFELSMEREVRVGDKLRALEMLSKYLGVAVPPAPPDPDAEPDAAGVIVLPEVEE